MEQFRETINGKKVLLYINYHLEKDLKDYTFSDVRNTISLKETEELHLIGIEDFKTGNIKILKNRSTEIGVVTKEQFKKIFRNNFEKFYDKNYYL